MSWPWSSPSFRWWKAWPAHLQTVHFSHPQVMPSCWQGWSQPWKSWVQILSHKKFPAGAEQIICQLACAVFSVSVSGPLAAGMGVVRHTVPSLWKVPLTGRYPRTAGLFPGGTAGVGKAMQQERGGFMAPASSLSHLDKAGSNQPFMSPGLCLSNHRTWIAITFQRDWEALFGKANKMPGLKGGVEGQCFN